MGGKLKNNQLIEGGWVDKPHGCSLAEADNFIHFNNNPVGAKTESFVSVCQAIEVRNVFCFAVAS